MEEQRSDSWQHLLDIFSKQLARPTFEMWFKNATTLHEDDVSLTIGVPSEFARDWIVSRYYDVIKETIDAIKGQPTTIAVEVVQQPPEELPTEPGMLQHNNTLILNRRYNFENFVVGAGNRLAFAASNAVAGNPGNVYNPLYIYGGVGLGKTHLLQGIAHHILAQGPDKKIVYTTGEKFTNEVVSSIQNARNNNSVIENFHKETRGADILLIDDIQFLAGKERTQEEFFHIFNALYDAHKQIVITSDVLPKEIATLEERLTSRFEWGLIADISRPDYETKVAILKKKAELDKIDVPPEVLEYIAANIGSNIRELEGALMRVLATASLTNEEVTLPFTEETLKDIIPVINKPITIDAIMQSVSSYFHISVADLQAKRRSQDIAMPRQIAMYLSRDLTEASLPYIGEKFGGRDHTTVIYACQKIQQELKNDDTLRALLDSLVKQLKRGV
ncbi:chromosomal replication initiator protein DnaA [Candidatus Cryosericum odellii]|jgi:chromosomal replication initiator protein|uniref:Chromosomal replication initiator protein DnaA n=2 Tax=Candidatus Cryosericum odellii TaxID=2290917 RepID=A0A398D344_9BACT|nr:chromosomal replication initiator protein DnaA [Candidatus Cryosericum odellii]RIE09946.1 chromosomal replication initiator protein DnaA [Candidatus Cryosericum odellii]